MKMTLNKKNIKLLSQQQDLATKHTPAIAGGRVPDTVFCRTKIESCKVVCFWSIQGGDHTCI
ncbi:hypothetical protein J8L98_03215 [Pseudoalteromonas sp. MMG013]|uniref:Class I lanthipeptide n=1 Tax=Pseudoalteromonas aurantia 208 TaxID=1314867 RepID=A0ABR9EIC8_9GAMM|nr:MULTISPECIES: hypothetical protein [Pseudoalteromonas]MBE0370770.1 hypothetical protein [Pseudoalteromonas aurantia 208]MBQ4845418.1 hypothetical protein [Pseudoalteromonas sp. MMG005]MBQ4850227.1 hypothetical protein [Pseudoalteromonas sp. MMG012]MBQ4860705.1 hypothetical protein [Pseudoalteromonas sp. MMG013]